MSAELNRIFCRLRTTALFDAGFFVALELPVVDFVASAVTLAI
jgi:hypothetical protein